MNMFKPTKAKTAEEYISMVDEGRRGDIKELDKLIRKVSGLKPFILSGMLGYGKYRYKYASGREGDWMLIGLAAQKNYISLYVCAVDEKGYLAERYKKELSKANIGKSCIRFKKLEEVSVRVLEEIIKKAVKLGGMGAI